MVEQYLLCGAQGGDRLQWRDLEQGEDGGEEVLPAGRSRGTCRPSRPCRRHPAPCGARTFVAGSPGTLASPALDSQQEDATAVPGDVPGAALAAAAAGKLDGRIQDNR